MNRAVPCLRLPQQMMSQHGSTVSHWRDNKCQFPANVDHDWLLPNGAACLYHHLNHMIPCHIASISWFQIAAAMHKRNSTAQQLEIQRSGILCAGSMPLSQPSSYDSMSYSLHIVVPDCCSSAQKKFNGSTTRDSVPCAVSFMSELFFRHNVPLPRETAAIVAALVT